MIPHGIEKANSGHNMCARQIHWLPWPISRLAGVRELPPPSPDPRSNQRGARETPSRSSFKAAQEDSAEQKGPSCLRGVPWLARGRGEIESRIRRGLGVVLKTGSHTSRARPPLSVDAKNGHRYAS
jgi:hypothetical protein